VRIVATADDFGFSSDTVDATIQCLERGWVRSASIMAGTPETSAALAYAASHPQHSYGVHLTLTRDGPERPVAAVHQIAALVANDGAFFPGRAAQLRAATGRFPVDQLAVELEAQLTLVRDHGVPIDYVDSHKHLHKYPKVAEALELVLARFGITRVRRAQNVYPVARPTSPTFWLGRWVRGGSQWQTTDAFYMSVGGDDLDFASAVAKAASSHTLEIGAHPGNVDSWRLGETRALEGLHDFAMAAGHELIRWRDL
jgi:predicted glycoside hydrolase/deacetylase ChbG (UPF0249 family)